MNKRGKLYLYILSAIFIVFAVAIIFIYRFFYPSQKGDLRTLLSDNIELVIDINLNEFLKSVTQEVLFRKDLIGLSLSEIRERLGEKEEDLTGFDNQRQLVVFIDDKGGKKAQGILFHMKSLKQFEKHKQRHRNIVRRGNKNFGIIIYLEAHSDKELYAYYENLAEEIIERNIEVTEKKEALATVRVTRQHQELLQLAFVLEKQKLNIRGKARFPINEIPNKDSIYVLKPAKNQDYLEVNFKHSPDTINKIINDFTQAIGLHFPLITSQQIMVYNTKIEAVNKSLVILPELDWVLRFDQPFELKSKLDSLTFPPYLAYDSLQTSLTVKGISYYFQQLSENEIYIGSSIDPEYKKKIASQNSRIIGRPEILISLEGESFVGNLLRATPQIRGAKEFFKQVAIFEMEIIHQTEKEAKIEGKIILNKGKVMSVELLKFFLN